MAEHDVQELVSETIDRFHASFGFAPHWGAVAPGRVNLIGDHTDYSGGFALPFAINRYTVLVGAPAADPAVTRIVSSQQNVPGTLSLSQEKKRNHDWTDYVKGVMAGLAARDINVPNLDIYVHTNLPVGAGLSSSAALEVASACLFEEATGTPLHAVERALLCQQAEHEYAGVPCGIIDQFSIALSEADSLLLIDCQAVTAEAVSPPPADYALTIVNSAVSHDLADGEYASRRADCERVCRLLDKPLRETTLEEINSLEDETLKNRARHVISENARVHSFCAALTHGQLQEAGQIMLASHASLRDNFEVSCAELNLLVDLALDYGAFGARMTGGGFGGSIICMTHREGQERFIDQILTQYEKHTGLRAEAFPVRPVGCATRIKVPGRGES